MLKIKKINLNILRNEEHYQIHSEVKGLVDKYGAAVLGIEELYALYLPVYAQEYEALNVIRASQHSEELADADGDRDALTRGFKNTVNGFLGHFNTEKRKAAERIQLVLDHYSDIEVKPYDQETVAIDTMLDELKGISAADIQILGLGDWVTEMENSNNAFRALMTTRYTEKASKTDLKMKQVRIDIDIAYRNIVKNLEAQITLKGEATLTPFVNELNQRIERFGNILAQRKGRSAKSDESDASSKTE